MTTTGERNSTSTGTASVVIPLGNPAAGADWSYALTQPRTLVAVTATLTTSATVANRTPQLKLATFTSNTIFMSLFMPAIVASSATTDEWWNGPPGPTAGASFATCPIPLVTLGNGWTVSTVTAGLQAADQWSNIVLTFAG